LRSAVNFFDFKFIYYSLEEFGEWWVEETGLVRALGDDEKEKAKIKKKAEEEAAAEQRDVTLAQMRVLQLKRKGAPKLEILAAEAELAKEKREAELSRKTREAAEEGEEEHPRYEGGLTV
jgi:hypothetical protein